MISLAAGLLAEALVHQQMLLKRRHVKSGAASQYDFCVRCEAIAGPVKNHAQRQTYRRAAALDALQEDARGRSAGARKQRIKGEAAEPALAKVQKLPVLDRKSVV